MGNGIVARDEDSQGREKFLLYIYSYASPGSEKAIGLTTGLLPDRRAIIFPIHYPNWVTR